MKEKLNQVQLDRKLKSMSMIYSRNFAIIQFILNNINPTISDYQSTISLVIDMLGRETSLNDELKHYSIMKEIRGEKYIPCVGPGISHICLNCYAYGNTDEYGNPRTPGIYNGLCINDRDWNGGTNLKLITYLQFLKLSGNMIIAESYYTADRDGIIRHSFDIAEFDLTEITPRAIELYFHNIINVAD